MENDAQFKCPKCGNDRYFIADEVILYNAKVEIDRNGWDYWSNGADVDLTDATLLTCQECQYCANASEFSL